MSGDKKHETYGLQELKAKSPETRYIQQDMRGKACDVSKNKKKHGVVEMHKLVVVKDCPHGLFFALREFSCQRIFEPRGYTHVRTTSGSSNTHAKFKAP